MSGDVSVGDNYTLSIGQQSSNYDYIVPTSCIREDSNGKFILIVDANLKEKSGTHKEIPDFNTFLTLS